MKVTKMLNLDNTITVLSAFNWQFVFYNIYTIIDYVGAFIKLLIL